MFHARTLQYLVPHAVLINDLIYRDVPQLLQIYLDLSKEEQTGSMFQRNKTTYYPVKILLDLKHRIQEKKVSSLNNSNKKTCFKKFIIAIF